MTLTTNKSSAAAKTIPARRQGFALTSAQAAAAPETADSMTMDKGYSISLASSPAVLNACKAKNSE
jgi:hypothetical protein